MQSSLPMPGNPWPHEMLITIEDDSHVLVELLWIREAWGLDPSGVDLPPLLLDPPTRPLASAVARDRVETWQASWPAMWDACVHHAGLIRDSTAFERLHETPGGSQEREQMLRSCSGRRGGKSLAMRR